jgi:hypothetical protein
MNILHTDWWAPLAVAVLVCCGCSETIPKPEQPEVGQPVAPSVSTWSAPPKFIIALEKTPLDDRTQIDLEITNDSPHNLSVLEADLECYDVSNHLTAKVPVVLRDLGSEQSRKLDPVILEVKSLRVASTHFVVKKSIDDKSNPVQFGVVWR